MKWVNYRPICVFALAEAAGLAVTSLLLKSAGGIIISAAVTLIVSGILLLIKKTKFLYVPVAFALGIVLLCGAYFTYTSNTKEYKDAEITATISSEIVDNGDYYSFDTENVSVNGVALKKSATVYTYFLPTARAGGEIKMNGDMFLREFDFSGGFVGNYRNGNYYRIFADDVESLGEGKMKGTTAIRVRLKRLLFNNTDESTANIVSALMFSDKYGISSSLYGDVKSSGLAHLFAVSGLHIGILAGVFYLIARKLRLRGILKFIFILAFPTAYAAVCGFPASVIRALIMSGVFLAADVSGRQKDGLNSLALSAIIVMTIFPADTFSLGFQMSFLAVLSLITLAPLLAIKLKIMIKPIRDICASSVAVNLFLFPIMTSAFGEVQTLFILSNLLILPIMPFIYILTLLICLFVLIFPSTAVLLTALTVVVWPVKAVSFTIGSLALSSVDAAALGAAAVIWYFVLLLWSRLVFLPRRTKAQMSLTAAAAGVCLLLI